MNVTAAITEEQKSAYHEAGHAVIADLFGHRIVSIELLKSGDGSCTLRGHAGWRQAYALEARQICPDVEVAVKIVFLLAGMMAQSEVAPINKEEWILQDDMKEIGKLLPEARGRPDASRKLNSLVPFCQKHIKRRWSQVDALAKALLADGKIVKAKDIRRILGPRTLPQRKVIFELAYVYRAMETA